ncbi:MAG: hypothetical protein MRT15_07865 [archaeon YNP-LCB-003-016]|uniref:hypothetical protein n=1 Tax=Candidatus Culexarchaeum yellowstonense TaxID=2928963 RepID=UPI0026F26E05|nr:hypothetical protein [Candidatus Culexarchaeum yellowstonense]MCR6692292.1 hypothetical protein [Candidatus Culexarchaeum yellowstonense]
MLWDLLTGSQLAGFAIDILMLLIVFMLAWRWLLLRNWSNVASASSLLIIVDKHKNMKLQPVKSIKGGSLLEVANLGAFFIHQDGVYLLRQGKQTKTVSIAYTPIATTIPIEAAANPPYENDGKKVIETIPLHKRLEEVVTQSFTPSALYSAMEHVKSVALALKEEEYSRLLKYVIIASIILGFIVIGGAIIIKSI